MEVPALSGGMPAGWPMIEKPVGHTRKAAKIAVKAVNEYKSRTKSEIEVIFNVFKDEDYEIYKELLRAD